MSMLSLRKLLVPSPSSPATSTRLRILFLAVLAIVVVGMSVKYAAKVARPGDDGRQTRSAFLRWRAMIHDVFAGTNIYVGKHEYPNPPIMAVILRPFAELPPVAGALAWFYVKVLMAVLAAVWVFRLVKPQRPYREGGHRGGHSGGFPHDRASDATIPDVAFALAALLALPPVLADLSHGNVNIFILFLVTACLEAYRRGWDVTSGLVLALAIACKVTPLLFVAYFGWKRAWRVLAGCAAGLVLWLAVVPGLALGWEHNQELLQDWSALMVERPLLKGEVTTEHPNQAIPGFTYRLFTASPSFIRYEKTPDGDIPTPAEYHNLMDIGRPAAWTVVKGLTLAFGLLVMGLCRSPQRQGLRFAAECSLIVLGMLLFSERTWKHHAVTLLLPFTVLASAVFLPEFRRVRPLLIGVLVPVALLTLGTGALPDRPADLAMVYGTYTAAFVLLAVGVCAVLWSHGQAQPLQQMGADSP